MDELDERIRRLMAERLRPVPPPPPKLPPGLAKAFDELMRAVEEPMLSDEEDR